MFHFRETVLVSVLLVIVLASAADIAIDLAQGAGAGHVIPEAVILFVGVVGAAMLLAGLRRQSIEIKALRAELGEAGVGGRQPDQRVLTARRQLGEVIAVQFDDWKLTASEREVGWLLLKGLSLKEIAALRDTREKTVRQQASALYSKAGVAGRHAFAAWFIEDFL